MALGRQEPDKPRTRLQLGPGGLMFIVVSGLILAVAIYANSNLLYGAFGLMIGALIVSTVVSWQMMGDVAVKRILPAHGVASEELAIRYELINHKRWMPAFGVIIGESWGRGSKGWKKQGPVADNPRRLRGRPFGWVLHLGPNQKVQAEAPCWPLRRGPLRFERVVVSTSFPFGIIRRVLEFEQAGEVLIYPHLYRINRHVLFSLSHADPHGRKRLERAGGTEEFFGLREYRAGDSLKMIDWKRSARTGKLVSREMTLPSPPKIMLLLDLRMGAVKLPPTDGKRQRSSAEVARLTEDGQRQQLVLLERAVSLAASLVCDAYFHGYQVGMTVWGTVCVPFPVHHSLPHRTKMLEALAQLDTSVQIEGQAATAMAPSVIVRAEEGPSSEGYAAGVGFGAPMVMTASEMERFVIEMEGGSTALLSSRARPESRRQEMAERSGETVGSN